MKKNLPTARRRGLPWLAVLLLWTLSLMPRSGQAQIYYTLTDGSAGATLDQLRRVNANGSGDVLVKDSFVQSAGPVVVDAANNRLLVADIRTSQASTSLTNTKIVAVNLTTNAVSTVITPAAISGAAATTIGGLAIDKANNYIYYTLFDGAPTTMLDQLRRVNSDGSGDVLIKDNFVQTAGPIAFDAANNRVLVVDTRTSQASTSLTNTKIVAVSLAAGNAVSTVITPAIPSGGASAIVGGLTIDKANNYVYYTLTDGSAITLLDQLRRVNSDGSGDVLIKDNFVQSAGPVTLDLLNNRLLVADIRTSQASTSLTNTKIVAVSLAAGNAVSTVITPAAISGAASTTIVDIAVLAVDAPAVSTAAPTSVTTTSAVLGGNVTADGGAAVTDRGVVYSTTNTTPTTSDTKDANASGTGSFSENITGLTPGTTYYVRAYAINSVGTSYGSVVQFTTTANAPTVTTAAPSSIATTSAALGGNVTADGGATVTGRGVVYSDTTTTGTPTIGGTGVTTAANGSGTGTFSATIASLAPGTSYSVQAYATNSTGTSYGGVQTFTTASTTPTVTTTAPSSIATNSAVLGGNVTADGGAAVTGRGVVYSITSTNGTPAIGGTGVTTAPNGTGTGTFSATISPLTPGTNYSVRAYATNSQGTSYGTVQTFTTVAVPTVVSVTRLTPSPTATATVSYRVVFSSSVAGVNQNNFTPTVTSGSISGATVFSVSPGPSTTYTVTVTTGSNNSNGTLRLDVANSTGTTPAIANVPYTAGEEYTIKKSFIAFPAGPQLVLQAGGSPSGKGDVTAFVDGVQVVQNGTSTPVANALQNGGFETNNLGGNDFLYPGTGLSAAPWAFASQSGIARIGGSGFAPASSGQPAPNSSVAFLQTTSAGSGSTTQRLAVPTGTYQVGFVAAQRGNQSQGVEDQVVNVYLQDSFNTVFLGVIQPNSATTYSAFTSATFNVSAPALTATVSGPASPTSTSPIPFSVSFSQSVGTTFTESDVTVTGGTLTAGSFAGSGAGPYTFTVTPTGTGTVSVSVAANVAQDANNTNNAASSAVSVQYTQPVTAAPVITTPANGSLTNQAVTISGTAPANSQVAVYVSQNGAAFILLDTYTATGDGSFSSPALALSSATYQVYATAQSPGAAVSANSNTNTFTVDRDRPAVTLASPGNTNGGTTTTNPIPFTVTFTETVNGSFVAGDVTVTNGTIVAGSFSGSGAGPFTFSVAPSGIGSTVTVTVPANVAQDGATNFNTAAAPYSLRYAPALTATVSTASASPTSTAPIPFAVSFSQSVGTTFVASDVSVTGGAVTTGTFSGSGAGPYAFTVTPTTTGTVTVSLAAGVAQDAATTGNLASNAVSVQYQAPTITVNPTNGTLAGGTQGTAYSVTFSATGSSGPYTYTLSGTPPPGLTFAGSTLSGTPTAAGTYNFTITATDNSAAPGPYSGSRAYSLTIAAPTSVVWTGNTSTDWFTATNWTPNVVPGASTNATIPTAPSGGRFPALTTSAPANVRNLTLNSGAALTHLNGTLALAGNLTNNGSYLASNPSSFGTGPVLSLGGTVVSSIFGSSTTRFWNLTVGANGAQLLTSAGSAVQRVLTLDGNFNTNGNAFTLESNASGTAMIVNNGGNAVNGDVTVQRYIAPDLNPNLGYRHVSAPIGNATVSSLATGSFAPVVNPAYNASATPTAERPFPTVYGYDQARLASTNNNLAPFDKGWYSPGALSDALAVGQGYTVNLAANQTWNFVGPPNNGDVTQTLARNSGATANDAGLQLVGNPYPSPLDWSLVTVGDRPNVDAVIYKFASDNPADPYTGQYSFYNGGFGNMSPVLPLGQGFFVRVSQGQTSGTLSLKNRHRPTSYAASTYHRTAETRPVVHLTLHGAGKPQTDDAFVYFENGATNGLDAQYDGLKLANPSGLNLSSSLSTAERLCVNGLAPLTTTQRIVPLAVGVPAAGSYTLTAAEVLNLATTPVYLRDTQTGAVVDLAQQPSYSFVVSNASALLTGRFELVFSPQAALATAPAALAAQVGVYPNPATTTAFVELPAALGRVAVPAELVDALGRTVRTQSLPAQGAAAHRLDLGGLATGVYTLHLNTASGVVVKKLVVQ
jgi:hypothetical protein